MKHPRSSSIVPVAAVAGCLAIACAKVEVIGQRTDAGAGGGASMMGGMPAGAGGHAGSPGVMLGCRPNCTAFPAAPQLGAGVPPDAPQKFATTGTAVAPCLIEPEDGALIPYNWLRPRVQWVPAAGQSLFQVTATAPSQKNALVIYTTQASWTMPLDMWKELAREGRDQAIRFSVRALGPSGPTSEAVASLKVASVPASGTMVYWSTKSVKPPTSNQEDTTDAALNGFAVGDEGIVPVLTPPQVQMTTRDQSNATVAVKCVGCHAATPDGAHVAFMTQWPWGLGLASVEKGTVGKAPPYMTPASTASLARHELGIVAFSAAHWATGDRRAVSTLSQYREDPKPALVWLDLEATEDNQGKSYGVIARNGDPRGAVSPTWSPDGTTIVYTSTSAPLDGRVDKGSADLFMVPYESGRGGAATPVAGAATPGFEEYYPTFSANGALLAFNRVAAGIPMYNQPAAEVFVIPTAGGTATRLAANDAPACLGRGSPGIKNSWPKWSPEVVNDAGKQVYWLIFSSTRRDGVRSQLYMAAVEVDGQGGIVTYPAVYLWNQPADINNHTPAWSVFNIPTVE